MKRIGLCGGTYDPVHNGHLALIRAASAGSYLDQCIVMPAGLPPHKLKGHFSPAVYRLEMAAVAFRDIDQVNVSDLEIRSQAPSYTLQTIDRLSASFSADTELVLVYGSDILLDIERWYKPEAIMSRCSFYLAKRGGYNEAGIIAKAQKLRREYNARIDFFDCPHIKLSSTDVRQAIGSNNSWRHMVPAATAAFIEENGLYHNTDGIMALEDRCWLDLMRLEQKLWSKIPRRRLIHCANTMQYALHLALRHGVDLFRTAQAALLHDCAKDLPWPQQKQLAEQAGVPELVLPVLAHGPAGAVRAKNEFSVTDHAVFRAITCHTTGCSGMTDLDKILFLADKIEPARTYNRLDEIRLLAEDDLNRAMLLCIDEINGYLKREKIRKHPFTAIARRELNGQIT